MSQRTGRLAAALGESTARMQALMRRYLAQRGVSLSQARSVRDPRARRPSTSNGTRDTGASERAGDVLPGRRNKAQRPGPAIARRGHGRVIIVSISAAGRGVVKELLQRHAGLLADHLSDLPPSEVVALEAALPALSHLIGGLEGTRAVSAAR